MKKEKQFEYFDFKKEKELLQEIEKNISFIKVNKNCLELENRFR